MSILKLTDNRFYTATPERCYRNITVPFSVSHQPYYIDQPGEKFQEILLSLDKIDKQFVDWLETLDLEIFLARLFINKPQQAYNMHVDYKRNNDQSVALNFAFNDKGTVFSWYNLKRGRKLSKRPNLNNVIVYQFYPGDCEEVFSKEIEHKYNQPFLVNTGYIHSLRVGNTYRFCYSYFLRKKSNKQILQWDNAVDHFKDYIN